MAWRNCGASLALVAAVNARWPDRDKTSDGTIGDAAHATRTSDHNPWVTVAGMGVVRARDIDVDGIDAAWLVETLRQMGAAGDPRLTNGGYLIFNRRITRPDFSGWAVYKGANPHDHHLHVSFSLKQAGFDSPAAWPQITDRGAAVGTPAPLPADPATAPEEYREMKVIQSEKRGIALVGAGYYRQLVDAEDVVSATMLWGPPKVDNERRFDVWVSQATQGTTAAGLVAAIAALPEEVKKAVWAQTVSRDGQNISALQELADAKTLAAQLAGRPVADVDETQLAAELAAPLSAALAAHLGSLSDADVHRVAVAAQDEQDRRERARLASSVG